MLEKFLSGIGSFKQRLPQATDALPGRTTALEINNEHHVHGRALKGEFLGSEHIVVAMGCFWGVERLFWSVPGVITTAVGYAGGLTPNPTYREVCSGQTGHTEVVKVVFDPSQCNVDIILKLFWENHDPTQGMRQGNDVGTQYRSAIYCATQSQFDLALETKLAFQKALDKHGFGPITTEIVYPEPTFYFAETEHQQYLSKNPGGYCNLSGTGATCPTGIIQNAT